MNNEKDILTRFHRLLLTSGLTKSDFAKKINISHQSLNKYLKNFNDIQKLTLRLFRNGFSIHWLYSGKGEPLLNSEEHLVDAQIIKDFNYREQNTRIQEWIMDNYINIIEFEIVRGFRRNEIQRIFDEDLVIPYKILRRIENAGCNILWSLTGNGTQFADNIIGNKLKSKKL